MHGCPFDNYALWCLELLKAMYGLVDAPLLWQLCLKYFLIFSMGAFVRELHHQDGLASFALLILPVQHERSQSHA